MKQVYHAKERSAAMNYTELAECLRVAVAGLKLLDEYGIVYGADIPPDLLNLIVRCEAALKEYDGQWTP